MNPPYRRAVIEEWNDAPPMPNTCPPPMDDDEPSDDDGLGDPETTPPARDHDGARKASSAS